MATKLTIEDMQAIAKKRGGECLSKQYVNQSIKLEWKCSEGHRWKAKSAHVKNSGSWCPECAGIKKITIEEMQNIAQGRDGKCLSKRYVNGREKLQWECSKGHQWRTTSDRIRQGTWCPKCAGRQKLTIKEMQEVAKSRGGKCLSKRMVNSDSHLKWECAKGHQWTASPNNVKSKSWCPKCAGKSRGEKLKIGLSEMQRMAKSRGGKCLSKKYVDANSKLRWQCSEGHIWSTTGSSIKNGKSWCPKCSSKKLTIKEMQFLANKRGGKCLSKRYINNYSKLKWECEKGHRWQAIGGSIKDGRWCSECAGVKKHTIQKMRKIAKSRGGKCLSKVYVGGSVKLKWECSEGHRWYADSANIILGRWCAECSFDRKRLTIQEIQQIAKERGGKCLSKNYVNSHISMRFECNNGHKWKTTATSIVHRHTWCPECNSGIGERVTRAYFEQIFKSKFPKTYPKWLVNNRGNRMELDGYCKDLKIAFEHQGEQHYTQLKHRAKRLSIQLEDDRVKVELCKKNGIRLFIIPEIFGRTQLEDLHQLIFDECIRLKVRRPKGMLDKNINLKYAWSSNDKIEKLKKAKKFAKSKGGKCLSKIYLMNKVNLKWECGKGHLWESSYIGVVGSRGSWCPECAGIKKLTIEEMHKMAKERGGKCLSKKYVNSITKLRWECAKGHQWKTSPTNIRGGPWCPECGGNKKLTIEEMHKIAKSRGGKCLSKKYVNLKTKLRWECAEGHRWKASARVVRHGLAWCPECGGSKKLTIEEMHKMAKERGGKCLSKKYVNGKTKLRWECAKGHKWRASGSSIKHGTWCPECAKAKSGASQRLTIEEMHKVAKSRGGKCLSKKYVNSRTKLRWECAKGHKWRASGSLIKHSTWCPECAKAKSGASQRLTIEEMHKMAKERGGKCLSKKYVNSITKLRWECAKGHQWKTSPITIRQGSWCPKCARK